MYPTTLLAALVALSPSLAAAQVVGTAYGFATGVTGGGSAKAAAPSDIAQLKTWLSDSTARVILIDKTFNYIGSEGTVSEKGCRAKSGCNASNSGQDTIGKDSCDANESEVDVNKGIIQGKGLKIPQGTKNVIKAGRMFIVSHYNFDIMKGINVLLEGNIFSNAKTPITTNLSSSGANIFDVPDSGSVSTCSSSLGCNCVANSLSGSGAWPSLKSTAALSALGKSKANLVTPIQASNVKSTVTGKAGIGKI
ncbi:hypothetical protein K4K56_005323 [Colletotrichum sp. SAR 10_98]|nr:hypothetical protein K4K56_005323 [Colletotrichum sp. SAR 10_98]